MSRARRAGRSRRGRQLGLLLALAGGLLPAAGLQARPLTLRDLWRQEQFVRATPLMEGRRLLIEALGPYGAAGAFDDERLTEIARTRLFWTDAQARRPAPRDVLEGAGGVVLGVSPSGRRLALARREGRGLRLGVLDLDRGRARWTGVRVFPPRNGPSVVWRGETELIILAPIGAPDGATFPAGAPAQRRLQLARDRQARGLASGVTVHGSGRFARPAEADARLLLLNLASGRTLRLGTGAYDDLELSPSGRFLAVTGPNAPPRLAGRGSVGVSDSRPVRELTVIDLQASRSWRPCPACDLAPTLLAWSPTGERLLVYARHPQGQAWRQGSYRILDAARPPSPPLVLSGAAAMDAYGLEGFPVARGGWRGMQPLVGAGGGADGSAGWLQADAAGRLSPAPGAAPAGPDQPGASLGRGVRGLFAGGREAAPVRGAGGDLRLPLAGAELAVARDDRGVTRIRLGRRGRALPLLTLNAHLGKVEAVTPLALERTASTGEPVRDWLHLPRRSPGQGPPPLVVVPYPGSVHARPPASQRPGSPSPSINVQLLTAHGYAVLIPSLPRRPGDEPADRIVDDVLAAVEGAARSGQVDGSRVAVWGHSFGGYAALILAVRTHRFRAILAEAALSDLLSFHGVFSADARARPDEVGLREFGTGWSEGGAGGLAVPPSQDAARYLRNSPAFFADRVTAPVMLVSGDQDFVDPSQGEEMFSALRRRDKDARLVVVPGEGHAMASPANQAALQRQAFAFLDAAFRGAPETPRRDPPPRSRSRAAPGGRHSRPAT